MQVDAAAVTAAEATVPAPAGIITESSAAAAEPAGGDVLASSGRWVLRLACLKHVLFSADVEVAYGCCWKEMCFEQL
jgi:hypothetical protein